MCKGMVGTGTLCYHATIPPPGSKTDGDNHYMIHTVGEDEPRSIPPLVSTTDDDKLVCRGSQPRGPCDTRLPIPPPCSPAEALSHGLVIDAQSPPLARQGGGSQEEGCYVGICTVVPHSSPSASLGGGFQESGKGGNGDNEDGDEEVDDGNVDGDRIMTGNSEVLGSAPSEGIKSSLDGTSLGTTSNDGHHRLNKVASSSAAGGVIIKGSGDDSNKVVPSSPATEDGQASTNDDNSQHAKVKCMRKYRIMAKGAACNGLACCGEAA